MSQTNTGRAVMGIPLIKLVEEMNLDERADGHRATIFLYCGCMVLGLMALYFGL